nr:zinc finger BED domain-containing protein RICESLEEPER 2 [Tanacetum cinerariifolium]GEW50848.1 zinc finger BED domain-containing protein RICESLEEPER 2 [Tanacetum cinerariifolium]
MAENIHKMLRDGIDTWAPKRKLDYKRIIVNSSSWDASDLMPIYVLRREFIIMSQMHMLKYVNSAAMTSSFWTIESDGEVLLYVTDEGILEPLIRGKSRIGKSLGESNGCFGYPLEDLSTLSSGHVNDKADWIVFVTPAQQQDYIENCFKVLGYGSRLARIRYEYVSLLGAHINLAISMKPTCLQGLRGNIKSLAGDNQIIIVRGNYSRNGKRVSAFGDHSESTGNFLVAGGDDRHIRMHFVLLWDAIDATIKVKFGMGSNRRVCGEILTYYGDFDYEDDNLGHTINLNSAVYGHESKEDENNKKNAKKRKRKPGGGIRNEVAKCWKYFDLKMEQPDGPDRPWIKMAHCKSCPQVYRADSVKSGTKNMNLHYPKCDLNAMNGESLKQKRLSLTKDMNEAGEGCSSGILQNWKYDEKAIKKSLIELIVLAELPFKFVKHPAFINAFRSNHEIGNAWLRVRHLRENDCIPEENEDEENTPISFLTDSEKEDKIKDLVYEVETKMGVLSSDDELKKYLKEPPLELDDEEDFDILLWWKLNSLRFPIVSKMAKDILSIQISTVASESAFSTSGRVLDPYRNALSSQIVEALICTQSWGSGGLWWWRGRGCGGGKGVGVVRGGGMMATARWVRAARLWEWEWLWGDGGRWDGGRMAGVGVGVVVGMVVAAGGEG